VDSASERSREPGSTSAESTWVERVIPAPSESIFDLLADPSRHHEFDGSGSVRAAKSGAQRLELGSGFAMAMKIGIPYTTINEVVEYEPNRRIAWQTYSTIQIVGS
jgi:uncharacterized protein YndB with AHSA1/START domain